MNKIPTAEEFAKSFTTGKAEETTREYVCAMLIEFTKLHVKAALEAAADQFSYSGVNGVYTCILKAYSLENIK
jgi:hypothetical protein